MRRPFLDKNKVLHIFEMIGDLGPFISMCLVEIDKFLEVLMGPFLVIHMIFEKVDVPELNKDDLSLHC